MKRRISMHNNHFELRVIKDTSEKKSPNKPLYQITPTHEYSFHPATEKLKQEAKKMNINIFGFNYAGPKEYSVSEERKREILKSVTSIDKDILKELRESISA